MPDLLERIRRYEIESLRPKFPERAEVLEIGGGQGFQAGIIASWGCRVVSLDTKVPDKDAKQFFPVQRYDGVHVPFPDARFDVVYSSSTLEHVPARDLPHLLCEIKRVLKKGGSLVLSLPNSRWCLWTGIFYYVFALSCFMRPGKIKDRLSADGGPVVKGRLPPARRARSLVKSLVPPAHGEYPDCFSELYYFCGWRWTRVLRENGFVVIEKGGNSLFYSGYHHVLFPDLSLKSIGNMARVLGAVCHVFVARITESKKCAE